MSKSNREKVSPMIGTPRVCKGCGAEYARSRRAKYCSNQCRRRYFADRFDRWIANPECVALPQNFDEFLARNVLTCPVAGCEWEGEFLGAHVNTAHGISAREFKKLCGFNLKTGLIGAGLAKQFSDKAKAFLADGVWTPGVPEQQQRENPEPPYISLEAREHARKARADLPALKNEFAQCRQCGAEVQQPSMGRKLYCSVRCRERFYLKQNKVDLQCAYCGTAFAGTAAQGARQQQSLPVYCSHSCAARRNITAALAGRGIVKPVAGGPTSAAAAPQA